MGTSEREKCHMSRGAGYKNGEAGLKMLDRGLTWSNALYYGFMKIDGFIIGSRCA